MTGGLSVLVPYRSDGGLRDELWEFVQRRLAHVLPGAEVIVSDDRHENAELFNRPQALNAAARLANGDLFLIADADTTVSSPTLLREAIQATREDGRWRLPVTYQQLTQTASDAFKHAGPSSDLLVDVDGRDFEWEGESWSGLMVVPAEAYWTAGGSDERYIGWGADDAALGIALDTIYGAHVRFPAAAVHLWHERDKQNRGWHRNSIAQRQLTERYIAAAGDRDAMTALIGERP